MKTINKQVNNFKQLDTFEKVQLTIFSVVMFSLLSVVGQWALNGFITASF
tara:strand:- start:217 stop:366 length:150 start_codon:yes stop_codon:yes gene_type:complete